MNPAQRTRIKVCGLTREADVDAAYPVLLEAYRGGIATHTRLYPGAMEAVEGLKSAGFAVSICTNLLKRSSMEARLVMSKRS
jgi:phosphoglycolate phosphatase-like HAD superfamily hydrolase